jgi:hypothetical protein
MRVPMPSPNGTNLGNLYIERERLLPPVAAYDAINGNTSELVPEDINVIEKLIKMLRARGLSDEECAEVRKMLDGGMSMDDFRGPVPRQQKFAQDTRSNNARGLAFLV